MTQATSPRSFSYSRAAAGARAVLEARWALPGFLLLTVVLRAAALLIRPLEQTSDFAWYYERAVGLASSQGYSENGILTAFWPVGWPGALAALFAVTGPSVLAGQVANLVMAALVGWLTARIGAALLRDRAAGNLACLLLAVYPNHIAYVPLLSAEIFYTLLLLVGLGLLMRERPGRGFIAGLVFGVATLTKTQSLLVPGFLLAWVFLALPGWPRFRRLLGVGVAVYVGIVVVVAPWSYRNWTVLHAVVPVSTNGGWTLLTGNNPEANGSYTPETSLAAGITQNPADQVVMDRLARDRAVDWITHHPGRFVALLPLKFFHLWAPDGEAEWLYQRGYARYDSQATLFRSVRIVNQGYYLLLLLVALPSMVRLVRRPGATSPWAHWGLALFVFFTAISLVFSGQPRFHFSLMPYVALYAAWTVTRWADRRAVPGGVRSR